jgi:hypothetical protein
MRTICTNCGHKLEPQPIGTRVTNGKVTGTIISMDDWKRGRLEQNQWAPVDKIIEAVTANNGQYVRIDSNNKITYYGDPNCNFHKITSCF